jgi:hypothetical protein
VWVEANIFSVGGVTSVIKLDTPDATLAGCRIRFSLFVVSKYGNVSPLLPTARSFV